MAGLTSTCLGSAAPAPPAQAAGGRRDSARAGRGSHGACSCRVSTERSDAVHASWKQAGERRGGMRKGQLNPRSHSVGPTVHGQEGCQETSGRTSQCPPPSSALIRSRLTPTGL